MTIRRRSRHGFNRVRTSTNRSAADALRQHRRDRQHVHDPDDQEWTAFTVPMNDAAREVVNRAMELRTSDYMFAGRDSRSPIGERSLYTLINRLTGATAHGVARAGFSTWAHETQAWAPDHIIEASFTTRLTHSSAPTIGVILWS